MSAALLIAAIVSQTLAPDDVRRLALKQNRTIAESISERELAQAHEREARGLDDPIFSIAGTGSLTDAGRDALPSGQYAFFATASGTAALTQPLPTGGSVALSFNQNLLRTRDVGSPSTLANTTSVLLTVSHSLLRGVGIAVARAPRFRAEFGTDLARWQARGATLDTLRRALVAYWELAYAQRELAIREQSAALAHKQLEATQANITVGKQPPSAAFEVQTILLARQSAVAAAKQNLTDRSLDVRVLLALPLDGALATSELPEHEEAFNAVTEALVNSPAVRAAAVQLELDGFNARISHNDLLPQLDVSVSAGPTGLAGTANDAYGRLAGLHGYTVVGALTFSEALPNRAAQGRIAATAAIRRKSELSLTDVRVAVEQGARSALAQYQSAHDRSAMAAQAVAIASDDVAGEEARFVAGRSTNYDVLRRQDELAQAQLQLVRARVDGLQTAAILHALMGEMP